MMYTGKGSEAGILSDTIVYDVYGPGTEAGILFNKIVHDVIMMYMIVQYIRARVLRLVSYWIQSLSYMVYMGKGSEVGILSETIAHDVYGRG